MPWAIPKYSRNQVDTAGTVLIDPASSSDHSKYFDALQTINNWRACHYYPLHIFQVGLRKKAIRVDHKALVAQRIKRLSSIKLKLELIPGMKLARMQDIGGCRAIVKNVQSVDSLVTLYKTGDLKHRLVREDDYIRNPKSTGYRGIHLVYSYYSDKKYKHYNNLKVEMQIRTALQHAWATTVETVGTLTNQALKSSIGDPNWKRFFTLMGSIMAMEERSELVPGTPSAKAELIQELRSYADRLQVAKRLRGYGAAMGTPEMPAAKQADYLLLNLDPMNNLISVKGYKTTQLDQASEEYLALEKSNSTRPATDAVLVSVDSLSSLRRAYPNYFLDASVFISVLNRVLKSGV